MPSPTYNGLLRGLSVKNGVRLMVVLPFVLVSICLGMPDLASALSFDSFSLTGFVEPIPVPGAFRAAATFTATAQDFRLGIGFSDESAFTSFQTVRLGCLGSGFGGSIPIPCSPGGSVSAFAHAAIADTDVFSSMVLGGQSIPGCDINHHPLGDGGTLCVSGRVGGLLGWSATAPLPPFAGVPLPFGVPADLLNVTTVPGTFTVSGVTATIWQSVPPDPERETAGFSRPIDSITFGGDLGFGQPLSGPAQFDLQWQPDTGTWLPLFAEGRIDVAATPEPTTLLLVATTALGFCAARYRRRHDAQRGD